VETDLLVVDVIIYPPMWCFKAVFKRPLGFLRLCDPQMFSWQFDLKATAVLKKLIFKSTRLKISWTFVKFDDSKMVATPTLRTIASGH